MAIDTARVTCYGADRGTAVSIFIVTPITSYASEVHQIGSSQPELPCICEAIQALQSSHNPKTAEHTSSAQLLTGTKSLVGSVAVRSLH